MLRQQFRFEQEVFSEYPVDTLVHKKWLAGKDIASLRVTELTRRVLMTSVSVAYPTENSRVWFSCDPSQKQFLFRTCFANRIDLDAVAANMHGPAPPDKHKESARFMQPLLGEVVSTIKKSRAAQNSPGSTGPSLPTKGTKTSAEEILEKELTAPPSAVPGSTSNEAVEKWLKTLSWQSQCF